MEDGAPADTGTAGQPKPGSGSRGLPADVRPGRLRGFDLDLTHLAGMAFVVEKDKTFDQRSIGFFGGVGIIQAPDHRSDLI